MDLILAVCEIQDVTLVVSSGPCKRTREKKKRTVSRTSVLDIFRDLTYASIIELTQQLNLVSLIQKNFCVFNFVLMLVGQKKYIIFSFSFYVCVCLCFFFFLFLFFLLFCFSTFCCFCLYIYIYIYKQYIRIYIKVTCKFILLLISKFLKQNKNLEIKKKKKKTQRENPENL